MNQELLPTPPNDEPLEAFRGILDDLEARGELAHIKPSDVDLADFEQSIGVIIHVRGLDELNAKLERFTPEAEAKIKEALDRRLRGLTSQAFALGARALTGDLAASVEMHKIREELQVTTRQRLLLTHGEAFVAEVEAYAREHDVNFVQANAVLQMREAYAAGAKMFEGLMNGLRDFATSAKELSDELPRLAPTNRHERRAQKYKRPMKDGDQQWKVRRRRNRR